MYQTVVVAVDGSENSYRAAKEAVKITQNMTLLSVIAPEDSKEAMLHSNDSSETIRKSLLQDILDDLKSQDVNVELQLKHGVPTECIIEEVNSGKYDALVIGTRGLSGLKEVVVGSVSKKVIREVSVPVLVVK